MSKVGEEEGVPTTVVKEIAKEIARRCETFPDNWYYSLVLMLLTGTPKCPKDSCISNEQMYLPLKQSTGNLRDYG